jgi:hypothetical protein
MTARCCPPTVDIEIAVPPTGTRLARWRYRCPGGCGFVTLDRWRFQIHTATRTCRPKAAS